MSILKQIYQENGYIFDSQGLIMFGQKNNYTFLASEVWNGVITLMFSVKNDSAVQTLDAKVLKMEIPTVQHCSFKNHKIEFEQNSNSWNDNWHQCHTFVS